MNKNNNLKFLVLVFSLLSLCSVMSHAEMKPGGLFLEPAVTYESGTLKVTYPFPFSDSNETVTGYGFGLRLGGHIADIFILAADIRYAQPTYTSSALGSSASSKAINLGATVGLQTPIFGLRVWNTFILDGSLDPDTINNVNVKYEGFNGYRLGAGLYIAVVSVNLEYQEAKYKSTSVDRAGPFAIGSLDNVNGTQKSYILSVSFPIAF